MGPGPQRRQHEVLIIEGGQDQDPQGGGGRCRTQLANGTDPIQNRHPQIHEHQVGPSVGTGGSRGQTLDGLTPVDGFQNHLHIGLGGHESTEGTDQQRLIVDNSHPDNTGRPGHHLQSPDPVSPAVMALAGSSSGTTGKSTSMVKKLWSPSLWTPWAMVPPTSLSRSSRPTRPLPPKGECSATSGTGLAT